MTEKIISMGEVKPDPVHTVTQTLMNKLYDLIDKRHTGMLCIEIHMRNGGVSQVFATEKAQIIE